VPPIPATIDGNVAAARRPIPGAYERNTLTYRQPGSMGGALFGSDDVPAGPSTMTPTTIAEREKEGGGGISQRSPKPSYP
jgi:hypothetical protein